MVSQTLLLLKGQLSPLNRTSHQPFFIAELKYILRLEYGCFIYTMILN
jgi:hypothetical protein